jgi:hypothetical protein
VPNGAAKIALVKVSGKGAFFRFERPRSNTQTAIFLKTGDITAS